MARTTKPTTTIKTLPLDQIVPYWRNPRSATDDAIDKIVGSIQRYGYQQLITVDTENVIITGHTRYAALRRMGWTEAEVIVSDLDPKLAQEYRVVDNRAAEYTDWDRDKLLLELREFTTDDTLDLFFPEIDLDLDFTDDDYTITDDDVNGAQDDIDGNLTGTPTSVQTVKCPHCFESFDLTQ